MLRTSAAVACVATCLFPGAEAFTGSSLPSFATSSRSSTTSVCMVSDGPVLSRRMALLGAALAAPGLANAFDFPTLTVPKLGPKSKKEKAKEAAEEAAAAAAEEAAPAAGEEAPAPVAVEAPKPVKKAKKAKKEEDAPKAESKQRGFQFGGKKAKKDDAKKEDALPPAEDEDSGPKISLKDFAPNTQTKRVGRVKQAGMSGKQADRYEEEGISALEERLRKRTGSLDKEASKLSEGKKEAEGVPAFFK